MTEENMTEEFMSDEKIEPKSGNFFQNLSVRKKIFSGFAIVQIILVIVFAFGYNGFVFIGHEVEEMNKVSEEVALIGKVESEFLKLRLHAREFANLGNDKDAEEVENLAKKVGPGIEEILKVVETQPNMIDKAKHLKKEFEIYIEDFHKAEKLEHEFLDLTRNQLEPTGVKVVKDLNIILKEAIEEGNNEAVMAVVSAREHALLTRLYVNSLIGHKDSSVGPKVDEEFAKLAGELDKLGKVIHTDSEKKLHKEAVDLFQEYKAVFAKVHKDEVELRKLVDGHMKEAGDLLAADADWLRDHAIEIEHEIKEVTEDAIILAELEMAIVGGAGVLLGILIALLLGRSIANPLIGMGSAMKELADGNNDVEIPSVGQTDEIGEMAGTVLVFKEAAIENLRLAEEAERSRAEQEKLKQQQQEEEARQREEELAREKAEQDAAAAREREEIEREKQEAEAEAERIHQATENEKRLRQEAEEEKRRAAIEMADKFDASVGGIVERVSQIVANMQSSSETLNRTSDNTSGQASAVAAAAEEASTNVQTVAAAAEELSASVTEISSQVNKSTQIAQSAVTEAQQTDKEVQSLAQAAVKIGEVVELINDIASQTNLLALNATIEAARAGEAGKGFAVVASEVGNLANQTAKATEEISEQITGIQDATDNSVKAIGLIASTIDNMNEIASSIASAVEEQGAATQEIARNVEEASAGTKEVTVNITGVSTAAADTSQAAGDVNQGVSSLSDETETLKQQVKTFLDEVKAA